MTSPPVPAMRADPGSDETIFAAALDRPAAERAAFLDGACLGDAALRARVEGLLAAHDATANPLRTAATMKLEFAGEPADEAVGQTLGRYKLLERVGEGGCGVVYVAEQTEPVRRRVALKVIKLGMDTKQVVARFEAERQALALMDHPNIAKVLDAGTTETGRPYFVMELVRGIRITDYCDQANLSTKERLDLFIKVCHAIQHAHQKGIIHRDIKPSNILVTLHDGVPVPKVIDFGIAKATEGRLTDNTVYTQLHQFIGTPAYMSPEQAEMSGLDIDTRSDIYSLGVLLYELLAGSTPFDARELMASGIDAMRKTIREKEPQRPSTRLATLGADQLTTTAKRRSADTSKLLHQLKGDLDWIVMKCLEKDRQRRYDTANGLAADLKRHLNNEPVTARPPSTAYRFQKAFRRNKLVFAAGTIVGVALVLGVGISTWQAIVASRARQQEARANDQLRAQVSETEQARQAAEQAALAESQQRVRAEELVQAMKFQKAEDLLSAGPSVTGLTLLGQLLRANPSNEVIASRFVSALQVASPPQLTAPFPHQGVVSSAEFSPDGQRVVTASKDKTARVWDARSGQPLTEPLRHEDEVGSARFSPDGQRVLTASRDTTARVWDARSGRPLTEPFRHAAPVQSAEFSPDGEIVLTTSLDGMARVWDARSGRPITEPFHHGNGARSGKFSPDGQRVVIASAMAARVWDARSGRPLTEPLRHENMVTSAEFSPDGQRVLTASLDKTARVWDAQTGQPLTEPLRHGGQVIFARFSPDGQRVITAGSLTAQMWDVRSGQPLNEPLRHESGMRYASFSPDGQRVVTASYDETARVWDAHSGRPLIEPLRHDGPVETAEFSPDGQRVVTASYDWTARVWDLRPALPLTERLRHENLVVSAKFSPDGQRVVTASLDKTARVWDARSGRPLTEPLRHEQWVSSAEFSPDGQQVVTASANRDTRGKIVQFWDARSGRPVGDPIQVQDGMSSSEFSQGRQRIVAVSSDKTARVWDTRSGRPLTEPLRHDDEVDSVRFSPDGQQVVTTSRDRAARVWDVGSGQPLTEPLRHESAVRSAEFSPDGQRVVTAAGTVALVWDIRSGRPLTEPLRHEDNVDSASFSPEGQRVVTAAGNTVRVWDARSGQALTEPLRHGATVISARFSPDGRRVATASGEAARVWDALSGQPLTEPLRHGSKVRSAEFSPDGMRVVVTSPLDHEARVWEVPVPPVPAPAWFLDWAEARIGRRLDPKSTAGAVPPAEVRRQQEAAAARTDADFYTQFAKWAQADAATRTLSPHTTLTAEEYFRNRIEENTLASLREAVQIAPTNARAWARLALVEMDEDANPHPGRWFEAGFSVRQALRQNPLDSEAWHAQAVLEQGAGQTNQTMVSLEKSLQLDPSNRGAWGLKGRLLTQLGRPAEALAAYRNALAALPAEPVTAFHAGTELLQKHLVTLAQPGLPRESRSGQQEVVRWMVEEILIYSRRLPATGLRALSI